MRTNSDVEAKLREEYKNDPIYKYRPSSRRGGGGGVGGGVGGGEGGNGIGGGGEEVCDFSFSFFFIF